MKALPNFDFATITSFDRAIQAIEDNLLILANQVGECNELTDADRTQLVANIIWIKRFFEAAEQYLHDRN
jgi:uncharacterized protein YbaA (DUF1428 family)